MIVSALRADPALRSETLFEKLRCVLNEVRMYFELNLMQNDAPYRTRSRTRVCKNQKFPCIFSRLYIPTHRREAKRNGKEILVLLRRQYHTYCNISHY